jgi:hypothetical protein
MDAATQQYIDDHLEETIEELKRLTAQPSISAQRLGVKECGEMVVAALRDAGFTAELVPTADPDYPGIIAETDGDSDQTLLFYTTTTFSLRTRWTSGRRRRSSRRSAMGTSMVVGYRTIRGRSSRGWRRSRRCGRRAGVCR